MVPLARSSHARRMDSCAERHDRERRADSAAVSRRPKAASGGGGIRTRGPRERTPVFKTGAFDRSATPPIAASVTARVRGARAVGMMRARWRSRGRATPTCRPGASPGRSRAGPPPDARSAAVRRRPSSSPAWWPRRSSSASALLLGSLPGGPPSWPFFVGAVGRAGLLLALRAHDVARRAAALRGGPRAAGRAPGAAPRRPGRGRRLGRGRARGRPACARSPSTSGGASATTRAAG